MGNTQLLLLLDCLYAVGDGRFYLFGYAFGEIGGAHIVLSLPVNNISLMKYISLPLASLDLNLLL